MSSVSAAFRNLITCFGTGKIDKYFEVKVIDFNLLKISLLHMALLLASLVTVHW